MIWIRAVARFARTLLILLAGVALAVLLLEALLRVNPRLLLRGMGLENPVDPPLTTQVYDVRVSDADELYWRPDLIRPVSPDQDRIEAHVVYTTDEYGFRNPAPIPGHVDLAVLGRSYSLGAQNAHPWPDLVSAQSGLRVFNLSLPGADIFVKNSFFARYAAQRSPRWLIVEVEPGIDVIGADPHQSWLTERILSPILRHFFFSEPETVQAYRYPLPVQIPGRTLNLTCCINYMDTYTLSVQTLQESQDWAVYSAALQDLVDQAHAAHSCVAILYAPLKAEVYLPLASDPAQLDPVVVGVSALSLQPDGRLGHTGSQPVTVAQVLAGIDSGSTLLRTYAQEHHLAFINPTDRFRAAVLAGQDPYMQVDSHWSSEGHAIIAQMVEQTLSQAQCP